MALSPGFTSAALLATQPSEAAFLSALMKISLHRPTTLGHGRRNLHS